MKKFPDRHCDLLTAAIIGQIAHSIYAIRSGPGRHAEMLRLEEMLDKWYLDLPGHLRFDPASAPKKLGTAPPPHVLTLHAGYWSVVILLHRPLCVFLVRFRDLQLTPSILLYQHPICLGRQI